MHTPHSLYLAYIINAYLFFIPALPIWIAALFIDADPEFAGYLVTRIRYVGRITWMLPWSGLPIQFWRFHSLSPFSLPCSVIVVWSIVTYYVQSFFFKRVFQTEESRKLKHGLLILTNRCVLDTIWAHFKVILVLAVTSCDKTTSNCTLVKFVGVDLAGVSIVSYLYVM